MEEEAGQAGRGRGITHARVQEWILVSRSLFGRGGLLKTEQCDEPHGHRVMLALMV